MSKPRPDRGGGRREVSPTPSTHTRGTAPHDGVLAFYDGRVDGYRFDRAPHWVDEGALSLGIASYAIVSDREALVYDTHVSIEHARRIRRVLEAEGVRRFTVVLSHWHLDHVAGNAVFEDCEIIASERTSELLAQFKPAIERGEQEGPPPIDPLGASDLGLLRSPRRCRSEACGSS